MFYNRADAMEFALDFWDRPCRSDKHPNGALGLDSARDVPVERVWDQRKAPPAKYDLRFVYNPDTDRDDLVAVPKANDDARVPILDGKQLEDCAHFLSECLKAGGLRIAEQWSVPMLLMALRENEDATPTPIAKTLAEKVSRAAAQTIIDAKLLRIGDMIGYVADGKYAHSAMYTGELDGVGRVTCHTKSRFMGKTPSQVPDAWFLSNPDYSFTLVHISEAHPPLLGDKLAGWWQVGKGGTQFFFVTADGRAIRTGSAPKDGKAPRTLGAGDSRGYWFASPTEAKICWRADGGLATMKPAQDGKSAQVFAAPAGPVTATRLNFDPPASTRGVRPG